MEHHGKPLTTSTNDQSFERPSYYMQNKKPSIMTTTHPIRHSVAIIMLFLVLFGISPSTLAAPSLDINKTEEIREPVKTDSFGRDTPRSTVKGMVQALFEKDYELARQYIEGNALPKNDNKAHEKIQQFNAVLDRGGKFLPDLQLSDDSSGNLSDKLPANEERVGTIDIDGQQIDIILSQKQHKDGTTYWQFSKQTMDNLPKIQEKSNSFVDRFHIDILKDIKIFGYESSDLVGLLALLLISGILIYLVVWLIYALIHLIYPRLTGRDMTIPPQVILPLTLIVLAILLPEIMLKAGVPVTLRTPVERAKEAVAWIASSWLALRLIDMVFDRAEKISVRKNHPEQLAFLSLFRKLAKVFMLILALIVIFGNLGFDLTAGITALGIGGLALAFGAQKTIENLIGSVVVVADRPIHVGDYCKFGVHEGRVIDIGIRSTRVRTLNRTVVTIPNGEFSALQIENYATRDMFHFLHNLYIKKSSDLTLLASVIDEMTKFLENHKHTTDEWTQVRISELRQDCYVVEVRTYINTNNVIEFYDMQTQLILEILTLMQNKGVEQALPSQSIEFTRKPC